MGWLLICLLAFMKFLFAEADCSSFQRLKRLSLEVKNEVDNKFYISLNSKQGTIKDYTQSLGKNSVGNFVFESDELFPNLIGELRLSLYSGGSIILSWDFSSLEDNKWDISYVRNVTQSRRMKLAQETPQALQCGPYQCHFFLSSTNEALARLRIYSDFPPPLEGQTYLIQPVDSTLRLDYYISSGTQIGTLTIKRQFTVDNFQNWGVKYDTDGKIQFIHYQYHQYLSYNLRADQLVNSTTSSMNESTIWKLEKGSKGFKIRNSKEGCFLTPESLAENKLVKCTNGGTEWSFTRLDEVSV